MSLRRLAGWRWIYGRSALVYLWFPVWAVSIAHVITPSAHEWLHDIYRRLYYIPIILGGFLFGVRGAMLTAVLASVLYIPHAFFFISPHIHQHGMLHADPTGTANKFLEILLYQGVGLLTGLLVERERSARHEVEKKIVEMQAMEAQLIRAGRLHALGELTAGLAHEIRNPLASMKTATEIVADEIPLTSPRRKMVEIVRSEIDRLAELMERFLTFARPSSLTLSPVRLSAVVMEAIALVTPQAIVHRVEVRRVLVDGEDWIMGDTAKLTQILLNMLINAVQFSPEGGLIEVQLSHERLPHGEFEVVCISDEGPGISTTDRERIFDPFVSTRPHGTGLGLSIASRLMDEHHGAVELRDGALRGACFCLLFPSMSQLSKGRPAS
jgi:signal transduction histidine kinase